MEGAERIGPDRLEVVARLDPSPSYAGTVHEDATARARGFRGALIPGAVLLDHASRMALSRWGRGWLGCGTFAARFRRPVHDGDRVVATLGAEGRLVMAVGGEVVLEGALGADRSAPAVPPPRFEPHAELRPRVAPGGIRAGQRFGTADRVLTAAHLAGSRAAMGQGDPLYATGGLAHLAALVRLAMGDVLGGLAWPSPPVLTAVEGRLLAPVRAGARIRTSAEVLEAFERRGRHGFVSEEWLWADDAPALVQRRTTLYAAGAS